MMIMRTEEACVVGDFAIMNYEQRGPVVVFGLSFLVSEHGSEFHTLVEPVGAYVE
jgi:hypothetical protein